MTDYVTTRWYRAPEILGGWANYTAAVDMVAHSYCAQPVSADLLRLIFIIVVSGDDPRRAPRESAYLPWEEYLRSNGAHYSSYRQSS